MAGSRLLGVPRTRRQFLVDSAMLALGGGLLAGCAVAGPTGPAVSGGRGGVPSQLPRSQSLFIGGWQWGPPTSFNPLVGPGAAWPASGTFEYLYESLFGFNELSGGLQPILGKELRWPDRMTAVVTLQPGTAWQDGTRLTAEDVVYTLELAQRHAEIPYSTFWEHVSDVRALDATTVQFKLNPVKINPGALRDALAGIRILPRHIWQQIESSRRSLIDYDNLEPLGSGPYRLVDHSAERIVLTRHDDYWGRPVFGLPRPRYLVHPIFKSNDAGNLAFERGEVDLSQQFVPQIWLMRERRNLPVGTWFNREPYYVPGSMPLLFVNIHRKPLDRPGLRRALAHAINYPQIAATAMSRYSTSVRSSLILPQGAESPLFDEANVRAHGWAYDPHRATRILEGDLHATRGDDGIYRLPDGTRLGPFTVQTPFGWTDWMTSLEIVSQSAKAVGIDIQTEFPEAPVMTTRMKNGDFDLALWYVSGASPASPWLRFRDVLDDRGVPGLGESAYWNYNRYSNPEVAPLLDQAAAADSLNEQRRLYGELDRIFMRDVPAIPLVYRPLEFYQYNESVWTGFPNASHPGAPPMHGGAGVQILYLIGPRV
jgi:peptide/nickel transport system substrate-binding protein